MAFKYFGLGFLCACFCCLLITEAIVRLRVRVLRENDDINASRLSSSLRKMIREETKNR